MGSGCSKASKTSRISHPIECGCDFTTESILGYYIYSLNKYNIAGAQNIWVCCKHINYADFNSDIVDVCFTFILHINATLSQVRPKIDRSIDQSFMKDLGERRHIFSVSSLILTSLLFSSRAPHFLLVTACLPSGSHWSRSSANQLSRPRRQKQRFSEEIRAGVWDLPPHCCFGYNG